jgi:hypothetical protein
MQGPALVALLGGSESQKLDLSFASAGKPVAVALYCSVCVPTTFPTGWRMESVGRAGA